MSGIYRARKVAEEVPTVVVVLNLIWFENKKNIEDWVVVYTGVLYTQGWGWRIDQV